MNELSAKALALALTGILGACASDATWVESAAAGERPGTSLYAPGEVIVQFRAGTNADRIDEIVNATGMRIDKSLGSPLVYLLRYSGEIPIDEMIQGLTSYPEVRSAEPNQIIRLDPPSTPTQTDSSRAPPNGGLELNQVIIKFRAADLDPSRAGYLEQLFRELGVRLRYVRPMSGGSHVFRLESRGGESLNSVLERVSKHPDILYVELNRRMHHQ